MLNMFRFIQSLFFCLCVLPFSHSFFFFKKSLLFHIEKMSCEQIKMCFYVLFGCWVSSVSLLKDVLVYTLSITISLTIPLLFSLVCSEASGFNHFTINWQILYKQARPRLTHSSSSVFWWLQCLDRSQSPAKERRFTSKPCRQCAVCGYFNLLEQLSELGKIRSWGGNYGVWWQSSMEA